MPKIIVCQNYQNYQVIPIEGRIIIGRDSDNDIVLNSPKVSRRHASIVQEGTCCTLHDEGSTNAIWIDGKKIGHQTLNNGVTFRIADYLLSFIDDQVARDNRLVCDHEQEVLQHNVDPEITTMLAVNCKHRDASGSAGPSPERFPSEFSPLHRLIQQLGQIPVFDDIEKLHQEIFSLAAQFTATQRAFIAILDRDQQLIYEDTYNFSPDANFNKIHYALIRKVMDSDTSLTLAKFDSDAGRNLISVDALCIPYRASAKIIGCWYLIKDQGSPFTADEIDLAEVIVTIASLLSSSLEAGRKASRSDREQPDNNKGNLVVNSPKMHNLFKDVRTISAINVPVLILGEPGCGKELVAAELHTSSKRKGEHVTLNCSAIPEGIFENELFGSVRGAFHNAADRPGKLELAHNGTLFLDEIGDMALQLQPKLLRFLENGEVTRLGDNRVRKLDVRVVAATNQNLQSMIKEKTFRADLFQRLSCFSLCIPSLRERPEDIEPLVYFFLRRFSKEYGWQVPKVTDKAIVLLKEYGWPGNVRELKNTVLRLSVQAQGRTIRPDEIFKHIDGFDSSPPLKVAGFPSLEDVEKEHLSKALKQAAGNISDASKLIGIARSTLYKKMQKYNIDPGG